MRRIETTSLPIPDGSFTVTLAQAKAFAKIEIADDDALIQTVIGAATKLAEQHTQKRWAPRSFDLYYDAGELRNGSAVCIEQYDSGLATVTFTSFSDDDVPVETAIPATDFQLLGNRLVLRNSFPGLATRAIDAFKFSYTVGSAPASDAIQTAIMQMVTHWNENRETFAILDGFTLDQQSKGTIALLQTEKVYSA
jgi:hypothetical protein